MIFSCLGLRAQQGLIVTTAGDSILIEYSKIRLVQAPTRAATATILYDLSYIRFNIRASFGAFTAAADCNLFSFQDPTGKWFAVPISSIDQVKKKTGADNGYIFSEIEGARQDVVYEFQDDFWEVRDTLVACAQALSGSFPGVATDMSVTGNGTAGGPIKFVNDEDVPGTDKYYGTDTSGVKGWYDLPVGGGGGGGWWLTEDGDTMHVGTGQFVNMRDSGIITILFDTLTREMTFYAVSTPTDFGSGVNGDMAIWNGATLTSKTDAQFIWENNLPYGQGTANTMTYWVNDTLLGATAITYSATQWNAAALTGSLRLATGTTAERPGTPVIGDLRLNTTLGDLEFYNGTVWRSLAESMNGTGTPFELAIYNAAGALGDTTFAALLSAASGVTGSGASPRVAYWSGAGTLTSDANFLWDGQLSVGTTNSVYTLDVGTGGARLAPGANPVGAAGVVNFLTGDWFQGHNGTTYYYFARSDDVDPGAGRVWFQDATNTAQTTSANFIFSGTEVRLNGLADQGVYGFQTSSGVYAGSKSTISGSQVNSWMLEVDNSHSAGTSIHVEGANAGIFIDMDAKQKFPLTIGKGYSLNAGEVENAISISPYNTAVAGTPTYELGNGAARQISWTYGRQGHGANPLYAYTAAIISPKIIDYDWADLDIGYQTYVWIHGVSTLASQLDSAGLKLPLMGDGNFIGTPTYNTAFDTDGRLIERAFSYAEMHIQDTDPDTVSITAGSPAECVDWSSLVAQGFTFAAGRLTYTGTETAKFLIDASVSATHSVSGSEVKTWLYYNNSKQQKSGSYTEVPTTGDYYVVSPRALLTLATNDYIEVFFDSDTTGDIYVRQANLTITKQ